MSDTASPPAPPRPEPPKPEAPKVVEPAKADSAPKPPEAPVAPPVAAGTAEPHRHRTPANPAARRPAASPAACGAWWPSSARSWSCSCAWEVLTYYVAYTDDAYVRSDLIGVAPEVTGPIIGLYVVDNQAIKKGDKLYKIDPVPFQLEVNTRQAQIEEQSALVKVAQEELATAQAALESAKSAHTYATEQQARYAVLAAENNAPRAELDRANNELRRTAAEKTIAEIAIAKAQTSINVHKAALDVAVADKATAEWKLSKTDVNAPADGWINNLTLRIGDTGTVEYPQHRHRRRPCLAHHRQLQGILHPALRDRRHGLGVARQRAVEAPQGAHHRHRPRLQPRSAGAHAAALRRADHRLDPPAAPHPGDHRAGRSAARRQALHGRGRPHRRVPAMIRYSGTSPGRSATSPSRPSTSPTTRW